MGCLWTPQPSAVILPRPHEVLTVWTSHVTFSLSCSSCLVLFVHMILVIHDGPLRPHLSVRMRWHWKPIVHARKINHMLEMWDCEPHNIPEEKGLKIESQANDSMNQVYLTEPHWEPWTPKPGESPWLVTLHLLLHQRADRAMHSDFTGRGRGTSHTAPSASLLSAGSDLCPVVIMKL